MSYLSLARKYRPRRFSDMVGQESSTTALSNAIKLGREPRCIIFTGVRGVGKTTIARIYAKALNCEVGPTNDPCDICLSCLAIQNGNHEDVLEIDGASNTGVDDVRALQETLGYVPQRSKYKVYIIDEVHMLSTSAFNALLKTLEEPPEHVVFVFATTELHKVPETIQSRCQTFHLQKINRQVIYDRLASILRNEEIDFEEQALATVAREGRGSLRDALTALDQAIALGYGSVTSASIKNILGQSEDLSILFLLQALLKKDPKEILFKIAQWDQEGKSSTSLVEALARSCRNAMILKELKGESLDVQVLELEDKERQALYELATETSYLELNRLFRTWMKCLDDLRHSDLDRFVVENYALEWCLDPGLAGLSDLVQQLSGQQQPSSTAASHDLAKTSTLAANPSSKASVAQPQMALKDRWKKQTDQSTLDEQQLNSKEKALVLEDRSVNDQESVTSDSERSKKLMNFDESMQEGSLAKDHSLDSPNDEVLKIEPLKAIGPMPVSREASLTDKLFPSTWRELVDEWKKQKPLQARVFEETYVVSYGPEKIVLSVNPESMAGAKLLQAEARKKVQVQIEQMFGFAGQVEIQPRALEIEGSKDNKDSSPVGESLLETKHKERELARDQLRKQIQEHPITRELISRFDGTIELVELP